MGNNLVQEFLIRTLLGIDEVILVVIGAVGMIGGVIVNFVIKKKGVD